MESKMLESMSALKAAVERLREDAEAFGRIRVVASEVEAWEIDVGTDVDLLVALQHAAQRRVRVARDRLESSYMRVRSEYMRVAEAAARLQLDPEAAMDTSVEVFVDATKYMRHAHKVYLCAVQEEATADRVEYDDGDDVCQF